MLFIHVYFIFQIYFSQSLIRSLLFGCLFLFFLKKGEQLGGLMTCVMEKESDSKRYIFLSTPFKHSGVNVLRAFEHFCLVFTTIYMFKQTSTCIRDVPLVYTSQ